MATIRAKCAQIWARTEGSPTDTPLIQICADNSNRPGTVLTSGQATVINALQWSSEPAGRAATPLDAILTVGSKYWIVCDRTGSYSDSDYYEISLGSYVTSFKVFVPGFGWGDVVGGHPFGIAAQMMAWDDPSSTINPLYINPPDTGFVDFFGRVEITLIASPFIAGLDSATTATGSEPASFNTHVEHRGRGN